MQMNLWDGEDRLIRPKRAAPLKDIEARKAHRAAWYREDRIRNPEKYRAYAKRRYESQRERKLGIMKDYYQRHIEWHRESRRWQKLKDNYGLTREEYERMYSAQTGLCAICRQFHRRLCVDHDHDTGKIRKLLCKKCNTGLGMLGDDPALMEIAIQYLRSHKEDT